MNNSYSALMVDMRHSRCLSDSRRQSAQEDLANAMDCTNELFKTELEMPLMFSAGDELQGLFRSTAGAFLAYRFIKILVQTVDLRAVSELENGKLGCSLHCRRSKTGRHTIVHAEQLLRPKKISTVI